MPGRGEGGDSCHFPGAAQHEIPPLTAADGEERIPEVLEVPLEFFSSGAAVA
jgi:hypothetical protein